MKIIRILAALLLIPLAGPAAVVAAGFNLNSLREVPADIQVPMPQAAEPVSSLPSHQSPAALKEWTVMIFMNGSNNLSPYFMGDIAAIAGFGETADINVAVEFSLMASSSSSVTRRVRLLPAENGQPKADIYKEWTDRDMGDWRNAADFVRWAKASFPARRYMLIIQNHGGGFLDQTIKPRNSKGISYDEVSGNYIKVPELARLLKETGPVDLFIMNACEMQMAEVAYELGPDAGVIIASEELDRATFFQYKERLAYLGAHPLEPAEKIAAAFIEMRRKMLVPGNQVDFEVNNSTYSYIVEKDMANTLSALRSSELAGLPGALDGWAEAVMSAGETEAVVYGVASTVRLGVLKPSAQSFSQFTDLWNFAWRVNSRSGDQRVKDATKELFAYLDKLVVANAGMNINSSGLDYSRAIRGVSIKMIPLTPAPQSAVNPHLNYITDTRYEDLRLSKDSRWDEFLAWAGQLYYRPR